MGSIEKLDKCLPSIISISLFSSLPCRFTQRQVFKKGPSAPAFFRSPFSSLPLLRALKTVPSHLSSVSSQKYPLEEEETQTNPSPTQPGYGNRPALLWRFTLGRSLPRVNSQASSKGTSLGSSDKARFCLFSHILIPSIRLILAHSVLLLGSQLTKDPGIVKRVGATGISVNLSRSPLPFCAVSFFPPPCMNNCHCCTGPSTLCLLHPHLFINFPPFIAHPSSLWEPKVVYLVLLFSILSSQRDRLGRKSPTKLPWQNSNLNADLPDCN